MWTGILVTEITNQVPVNSFNPNRKKPGISLFGEHFATIRNFCYSR